MPLGTSLIPDLISHQSGGVTQALTAAQLSTKFGAGNIRTPSKNFSITYQGQHLSFTKNVPFVVDAGLAAYLTSINAPVS